MARYLMKKNDHLTFLKRCMHSWRGENKGGCMAMSTQLSPRSLSSGPRHEADHTLMLRSRTHGA
jgi:hypothetical protein